MFVTCVHVPEEDDKILCCSYERVLIKSRKHSQPPSQAQKCLLLAAVTAEGLL